MEALSQPLSTLLSPQSLGTKAVVSSKIKQTAKDFESVFMAQMLKPMWEGVETNGMFGGGPGEDAMRDLLIQEYGKAMASSSNSGLSDAVTQAMLRMQETADQGIKGA